MEIAHIVVLALQVLACVSVLAYTFVFTKSMLAVCEDQMEEIRALEKRLMEMLNYDHETQKHINKALAVRVDALLDAIKGMEGGKPQPSDIGNVKVEEKKRKARDYAKEYRAAKKREASVLAKPRARKPKPPAPEAQG